MEIAKAKSGSRKLLFVPEMAKRAGRTEGTIRKWLREERLPGKRHGVDSPNAIGGGPWACYEDVFERFMDGGSY